MKNHKFPSIKHFKNTVYSVGERTRYVGRDADDSPIFDHSRKLPTLPFRGTVKLHGTNASIVYIVDTDEIVFQSRTRILKVGDDNAAFALTMSRHIDWFKELFRSLDVGSCDKIIIYGEWCGKGIAKGVAINALEKMFVVFGLRTIDNLDDNDPALPVYNWLPLSLVNDQIIEHGAPLYTIEQFPMFEVDIDFERPEIGRDKMVNLTQQVEDECPVGKAFGVSGTGEGIVWTCSSPEYFKTGEFCFKVKGAKHSTTKVKTLTPVDIEAIEGIREFVEFAVTDARLEQGVEEMREQGHSISKDTLGLYVKWVYNDVLKEEMETIVKSQIDPKKLGSPISNKARPYFFAAISEETA